MRRALELARRGRGLVSPNPMVGAVVVRDGAIVGEGWHQGPGHPTRRGRRAADAGDRARGATVYSTLEPCNHTADAAVHGRDRRRRRRPRRVAVTRPEPDRRRAPATRASARRVRVAEGVLRTGPREMNRASSPTSRRAPVRDVEGRRVPRRQGRGARRLVAGGSPARTRGPTSIGSAAGPTRSSSAPAPCSPTILAHRPRRGVPRAPPLRVVVDGRGRVRATPACSTPRRRRWSPPRTRPPGDAASVGRRGRGGRGPRRDRMTRASRLAGAGRAPRQAGRAGRAPGGRADARVERRGGRRCRRARRCTSRPKLIGGSDAPGVLGGDGFAADRRRQRRRGSAASSASATT